MEKEEQDKRDFDLILDAFGHPGYDKGVRGIHMRLLHQTPAVIMNQKKIPRLMQKFNLRFPIRRSNPYIRIARALQTNQVAPNLLNRECHAHGARTVLLTDITYIKRRNNHPGSPDKYTYLSVIMDAFTREVLSYVVSLSIDVDFVLEMVNQLLENHGYQLKTNVLIHSDQGCHYTSSKFIDIINNSPLCQSMSRRGNCWDNAPQKSLFGHMKDEIKFHPNSDTHPDIARKINDWIDYNNNEHYQWSLEKLSPKEFYAYLTTGNHPLPIAPPKTLLGSTKEADQQEQSDIK